MCPFFSIYFIFSLKRSVCMWNYSKTLCPWLLYGQLIISYAWCKIERNCVIIVYGTWGNQNGNDGLKGQNSHMSIIQIKVISDNTWLVPVAPLMSPSGAIVPPDATSKEACPSDCGEERNVIVETFSFSFIFSQYWFPSLSKSFTFMVTVQLECLD